MRRLELADIVRAHAGPIRATVPLPQRRVLEAIEACRTAALGGHLERCDRCHAERAVYHSCGNRHCPKCQTLAQQRWIEARRQELLALEYFHVVFTLPHALHPAVQARPRLLYDLLFQSAAATLQAFGRDPTHLGGEIGVTAVLHTWGQNLSEHVHLHCIVPGGALADHGARFVRARRGFLFPVRALSKVFRAKLLEGLRRARARGELPCELELPMNVLQAKPWVVYAKPSFQGPDAVIEYLGRYTHRIALSNDRLLALRDGVVHLRWRDYADGGKTKILKLPAPELLRRFLLHVLPPGFVRIRHFGLLANGHRKAKVQRCRELLKADPPTPERPAKTSTAERILRATGIDITRCPRCTRGTMLRVAELPSPRRSRTSPHRPRPPPTRRSAACG